MNVGVEVSQWIQFDHSAPLDQYHNYAAVSGADFETASVEFEFVAENLHEKKASKQASEEFVADFMSYLCNQTNLDLGMLDSAEKLKELVSALRLFDKEELIGLLRDKNVNKCKLAR